MGMKVKELLDVLPRFNTLAELRSDVNAAGLPLMPLRTVAAQKRSSLYEKYKDYEVTQIEPMQGNEADNLALIVWIREED